MDSDQAIKEPLYRIMIDETLPMDIEKIRITMQDKRCLGGFVTGGHKYLRENHPTEVDRNGKTGEMRLSGLAWHSEECRNLADMFRSGKSLYCIAKEIGRTPMDICFKLSGMGLINGAETKFLDMLVAISAPASLRSLKRDPAAA